MVANWRKYVVDKDSEYLVFRGDAEDNRNEIRTAPYSHRFQQEYTEMQYAKIQGFIRGALREYDDPHLSFLTFSTTTTTPAGEPRPPIDHLNELLDPWDDGVYTELDRSMTERHVENCEECRTVRCAVVDHSIEECEECRTVRCAVVDHSIEECGTCRTERVRCDGVGTEGHSVDDCESCETNQIRCGLARQDRDHRIEDCPNCYTVRCDLARDHRIEDCSDCYTAQCAAQDPGSDEPRDWEYLYILEPTTDEGMVPGGYAHAHAAVIVDGSIEPARFESVIDRHLEECPGALGQAHEFDTSIEVKAASTLNNPGAYLFKYLGKSWDVEEMEDYEERFAALIFDQGRQRFRPSNGAQRWMQLDEDDSESGRWRFEGIADEHQAERLRSVADLAGFRAETDHNHVSEWLRGHSPVDLDEMVRRQTHDERRESDTIGYDEVLRDGEWVKVPESHDTDPPGAGDRPPP